jgi:hypothetical protein
MNPDYLREVAERDQLWASLRALRVEIDLLAAGGFDASERHLQMVRLLAQLVAAEMDFRARDGAQEQE